MKADKRLGPHQGFPQHKSKKLFSTLEIHGRKSRRSVRQVVLDSVNVCVQYEQSWTQLLMLAKVLTQKCGKHHVLREKLGGRERANDWSAK